MTIETKRPAPAKIRARRERLWLTRQQLAVAADCSISMLALLERGYDPTGSAVRRRIERVLEELEAEQGHS